MTLRAEIAKEISNPLPGYHPKVGLVYVSISGPVLENVVSNLSALFQEAIEEAVNTYKNGCSCIDCRLAHNAGYEEFRQAMLELVKEER